MMNFFRSLLGQRSHEASAQPSELPSRDNPLTIEEGSDNAIRRQLVQMLVRDALRLYGIPTGWIECQMLLVNSQSRGAGMYVRLVVRHWDDRLMTYAYAFQTALLADIARFEPHAPDWLHGISWQLEVGHDCPHVTMPEKSTWAQPAPVTVSAEIQVREDDDQRQDLERLFKIRDQELGLVTGGHPPVGYEKTQPAHLTR